MYKIITSTLALIVLSIIIWKVSQHAPKSLITEQNNETIINKKSTKQKVETSISKDEVKARKKRQLSRLEEAQKNHKQAFHPDPAIDVILLDLNLKKCLDFLNNNEDRFGFNSFKALNVKSKTQQGFKKKHEEYCDKLNNDNPNYLLTKKKQRKLLKRGLDKSSRIGKILSGFYNQNGSNFDDFDIVEEIQHLKDTDPNLLLNSNRYFRQYFDKHIKHKVVELIQSHEKSYIVIVMMHAQNLYACEHGANCGEFSNLVAKSCIDNNLCGSSYNDIITNKISKGILLDIKLVYQLLNDLYGNRAFVE